MRLRINDIPMTLEAGAKNLREAAAEILCVPPESVLSVDVLRKSLDARRNRPPFFVYAVVVTVPDSIGIPDSRDRRIALEADQAFLGTPQTRPIRTRKRPVVVGSGPAGLFAALVLARSGLPVLLVERGKAVAERIRDVQAFWEKGEFHPESHVHFGEGGAGTFSDGKLTSRVKNPLTAWVKKILVEMGPPVISSSMRSPISVRTGCAESLSECGRSCRTWGVKSALKRA